jgi:hypothetical protein
MRLSTSVLVLAGAVIGAGLLAFAGHRARAQAEALIERLVRAAGSGPAATVSFAELDGLPAPAQRYLRAVLREGDSLVWRARLVQRGEFRIRQTPSGWRPFSATEHFTVRPPGFVWDAGIRVGPGMVVSVLDGFVEGTGQMRARLQGLLTLAAAEGTAEIAAGALHRYLAEAVWLPTALLPSQGVVWTPLDDTSARATVSAGTTAVSLDFRFGADGLVAGVFTAERARDVGGRAVPTPWQGRFSDFAWRGGMLVPLAGEVEWVLPEGPRPYWRGRIVDASYWRRGCAAAS